MIELDVELVVGRTYELSTKFWANLDDDLSGFYLSKYKHNGTEKFIATTQMQPTDARKVFPCFDEPAMKAVFNITIIHLKGTKALFNSEFKSGTQQMIDGKMWEITEFISTKPMSTYLLAIVVCEFEKISSKTITKDVNSKKTIVNIWARPEAINDGHADYALSITGRILEFFEKYYDTSYPLLKLDQVALPDFSAGAMENWGLITYRETALLYEQNVSSTSNKEWIATVIAHELAHQWFGNLVTMKWWNDLWLNEGFATYASYLGAHHVEDQWNIKDLIVLNQIQSVFQVDSLASSHPLSCKEQDVNTPDEIRELFDTITYSKGAAVLRMLSDLLTEEVFTEGLKTYLKKYEFNNTVNIDLWEQLQEVSLKKNYLQFQVGEIMNTWTQQMGYPLITINTTSGYTTQKHFLLNPNAQVNQSSEYNYVWHVPIRAMKSGKNEELQMVVKKDAGSIPAFQSNGKEWILANINCTGYFRVNYDLGNWNRLLKQLESNHSVIPIINRAQLIDDAFNLARANYVNTTLALDTTRFLFNDTEYIPWQSALNNLDYFYLMFDRSEVYGPMQVYLRKQVGPLFNYFENITANWTEVPNGLTDQYNQINAISVACSNGVPECQEMASTFFKEWMENPSSNPIQPNLKTAIYCSAIATGGEEEWNFAWEMFQNATVATEKDKLRFALSCSKKIWILNRYLEYSLDPDKIRKMDATSTITYIAANVVGQSLAWDFVREKWTYIYKEYGSGIMSFSTIIDALTQRFSSEFEFKQLEQFKKEHEKMGFGSATRVLEQALERTKLNINWVQENKKSVLNWFKKESIVY
ncbi:AMPN Aminopeptidase, partial [Amia calva]|nr:AMPN Aminopeptidase [Amia calva]